MIHIDHVYIRLLSSQLSHFKQKASELYNFRCPICGDSQKNKYKSRGYVFRRKDSLIYKCHNCGDSRSLGNLIKHVDPNMYSQYVMAKYGKENKKSTVKKMETMKFEPPKFHSLNPLTNIGAIKLSKCHINHSASQFVRARKLPLEAARGLYYIDDEEKLEAISPKYKDRIAGHAARIIIPFCDKEGNMNGLTGRALTDRGLRYLTLKFNADDEPLIFGLESWNGREHTYVVEGPLDALFLHNCLAVAGADFGKLDGLVDKDNTTIIFDNEPRNKEIVKRMEKIIKNGWTVCIWPEKTSEKDVNDMVIAGQTSKEIEGVINRNKFSGLQAKFKLSGWKKC